MQVMPMGKPTAAARERWMATAVVILEAVLTGTQTAVAAAAMAMVKAVGRAAVKVRARAVAVESSPEAVMAREGCRVEVEVDAF